MIIRNSRIHSNRTGDLVNRINNFSVIKKKFEDFFRVFFQSSLLWAEAFKLLLKACYLLFKVRVLRFQRRNLLRKQRDLLLKKIDYVLTKPSGRDDANRLLSDVFGETCHSGKVDQTGNGFSNPIIFRQIADMIVSVNRGRA